MSETSSSVQRDSAKKTERYSRRELIGIGAFKTVYKAYDAEEGREVAWNQVKLSNVKKQSREKILSEIAILEQLHHDRIMSIYDSWESEDGKSLVFITEIMSSGTLKDFLSKAKKIKMRNVKKWCTQILQGLHYLHKTDPHPIIHRDLKCDNIFMNGNRSEVKIGDLGLSISMKDKKFAVSVIGTPEFMAPELYDEHYTEKVDIYAFGMCVLEMVTGDYPYCECENPAQVFRRVSQGIKPKALDNIQDELTKEFIKVCLLTSDQRPSAESLLIHPFFSSERNNDITLYFDNDDEEDEELQSPRKTFSQSDTPKTPNMPSEEADYTKVVVDELPNEYSNTVVLKVFLNLQGSFKQIKFPYNKEEDTPDAVASEMGKKFTLSPHHRTNISLGIANTIEELEKGNVILAEDLALAEGDRGDDEFVLEEDGDDFSSDSHSMTTDDMMDDTSTTPSHMLSEADIERPKSAPTPDASVITNAPASEEKTTALAQLTNSKHSDSLNVEITSKDGDSISSAPDNLESIAFDTVIKANQQNEQQEPYSHAQSLPHDKVEPVMSEKLSSSGRPDSEVHELSELKELPTAEELPDLTAPLKIDVSSSSTLRRPHSHDDLHEGTNSVDAQGPTSPRSDTPVEILSRQQEIYLQHKLSIEQRYQKQIDQLREQIVDLQRRRDDEVDRLRHRSDAVNTSPLSATSASSLPVDAFSMDNSSFAAMEFHNSLKRGKLVPTDSVHIAGRNIPQSRNRPDGGATHIGMPRRQHSQQNMNHKPRNKHVQQQQQQRISPPQASTTTTTANGAANGPANGHRHPQQQQNGRRRNVSQSSTSSGVAQSNNNNNTSGSNNNFVSNSMSQQQQQQQQRPPLPAQQQPATNTAPGARVQNGGAAQGGPLPPHHPQHHSRSASVGSKKIGQARGAPNNMGGQRRAMREKAQSSHNHMRSGYRQGQQQPGGAGAQRPPQYNKQQQQRAVSMPSGGGKPGNVQLSGPHQLNNAQQQASRMHLVDNFDSLVNVMKDSLRKAEEKGTAGAGGSGPTLSQMKK